MVLHVLGGGHSPGDPGDDVLVEGGAPTVEIVDRGSYPVRLDDGPAAVISAAVDSPMIVHVIEPAVVGVPPEYAALEGRIDDLDERADVADVRITEQTALLNAHTTAIVDGRAALLDHIGSATPHPAYDDMPSLKLLFENGLI